VRVLVCGGRDFRDRQHVFSVLDAIHAKTPITCIIEGGASGVDSMARVWSTSRKVGLAEYPALWHKYGRAAGYIRNGQMLNEGFPDLVVAFPGGAGTRNMIEQARKCNVPVELR